MYYTVLKMTRDSILNASELLDIYSGNAVHKWLTSQQKESRKDNHLLYRIIEQGDDIYFYIQSDTPFTCKELDKKGFIFCNQIDLSNKDITSITSFDLQYFPYVKDGKHYSFIRDQEARRKWITSYFASHGIELIDFVEYKIGTIIIDKEKIKEIPCVAIKGKIKVTDEILALKMIQNGVSRMKAYGLGLVLVK